MIRTSLVFLTATVGKIPICVPLASPENQSRFRLIGLDKAVTKNNGGGDPQDHCASVAAVKEAFRERCKEVHPDCGGSEEEFRKVNEAYQSLMEEHGQNVQRYGEGVPYPATEEEEKLMNNGDRENHCGGYNPFFREESEAEVDNDQENKAYQDDGSFRSFSAGFQHQRSPNQGETDKEGDGGEPQQDDPYFKHRPIEEFNQQREFNNQSNPYYEAQFNEPKYGAAEGSDWHAKAGLYISVVAGASAVSLLIGRKIYVEFFSGARKVTPGTKVACAHDELCKPMISSSGILSRPKSQNSI